MNTEFKKKLEEHPGSQNTLCIEPVYGCKNQCPQCTLGDIPEKLEFMEPGTLRRTLTKLKEQGVKPIRASFTLRGDPLAHAKMHELTGIVKEIFPKAIVRAVWGLSGVKSEEDLLKKTKGLDQLVLSIDGHHYAGILKQMLEQGLLSEEALSEKGFKSKKEAVFEEIRKRVRWAVHAHKNSKNRSLTLKFSFAGTVREGNVMTELVRSAVPRTRRRTFPLRPAIPLGERAVVLDFVGTKRDARGYEAELSAEKSHSLNVFHSGAVGFHFTPKHGVFEL